MTTKTIVVLANSWKKGGRCIAGKEVEMSGENVTAVGNWIRPISRAHVEVAGKSEGGQVTELEMLTALNREKLPEILELVEIPFDESAGVPDQPENWAVSPNKPWRSRGMLPRELLAKMADAPSKLWDSSGKGWSRVDETYAKDKDFASLYLVAGVGPITAEVGTRSKTSGSSEQKLYKNLKLRYGGMTHEFRISDPAFDSEYSDEFPAIGQPRKFFTIPAGTFVTVSLTPAYSHNGKPPRFHYKMAAAIIKPARK